jgi:hypothetical protein
MNMSKKLKIEKSKVCSCKEPEFVGANCQKCNKLNPRLASNIKPIDEV